MSSSVKRLVHKVREINHRYRTPRIPMSAGVRFSLMALRIYLLYLVSLMAYKFILLLG